MGRVARGAVPVWPGGCPKTKRFTNSHLLKEGLKQELFYWLSFSRAVEPGTYKGSLGECLDKARALAFCPPASASKV